MQEQSQRMLAAGWILKKRSPDDWLALSPEGNSFSWTKQQWLPDEASMLAELAATEQAILEKRYSPFLGTCRLSASPSDSAPGILTQWLAEKGHARAHSILRARVHPDPAGDELLYAAGARRVETLLPPWPAAPNSQRFMPFHLLICEHVADVLPQADRTHVLPRLITHLAPKAPAYFSLYQMEALPLDRPHRSHHDGYLFKHGPHEVYLKPTLPGRGASALKKILGGFSEEINLLYNEIFCKWLPDD